MWSGNGDDNRFGGRRMLGRASQPHDRESSGQKSTGAGKLRRGRSDDHGTKPSMMLLNETPPLSCRIVPRELENRHPSFAGKGPNRWVRSDEHIRDDVCSSLTRHRDVDPSDIEIGVVHGTVILSGTIADAVQKRLVESIVSGVIGVREIQSEIHVESDSDASHFNA